MGRSDLTDEESSRNTLKGLLKSLNRAIVLKKIGLNETAEIILHDNITIGGKDV